MKKKIAIVGLGYVGLPLAAEFAKKYEVIGFDISLSRIKELEKNHDSTLEIRDDVISSVRNNLNFISSL
jgi:UDP-N-acetyl-D-galactosamine dehydrogenase